jgi:hypothetical protein
VLFVVQNATGFRGENVTIGLLSDSVNLHDNLKEMQAMGVVNNSVVVSLRVNALTLARRRTRLFAKDIGECRMLLSITRASWLCK